MAPKTYKGESGYLDLLRYIQQYGIDTPDRTDVGQCRKVFNQTLYFDLSEGFPCSTVRPMSLRYGFEEIMMFLNGVTDTKTLEDKGIYFWKGHTSRDFLDSRGLYNLPEGSLGKSYSYQYRGLGEGSVDQIKKVYGSLEVDPFSRRHCVDIWAPNDHEGMPLTPCWKSHQFSVENTKIPTLHLTCEVRSSDALFGLVNNYQQFAFYLQAMARTLGYKAGTLVCNLNDVHIYENQLEFVSELLTREYYTNKVELVINKELNSLEDLLSIQWNDLTLEGLVVNKDPFKIPKPTMAV